MKHEEQTKGAVYAAFAYFMWGVVPIYWKLIDDVSAGEILAHRIIWSFGFMVILLLSIRKWRGFIVFMKEMLHSPKKLAALFTASVLVSANWGIFIWAVNSGHILETSLGYYINPLVSVLLGVIVLKERLSGLQIFSFILAAAGVLILTFHFGKVPWVALSLALTFGLYGLAKKMIKADAEIGLALETLMVTPFALLYWLYAGITMGSTFGSSTETSLLLIGGGIVTALPLLFFAKGAQRVPLSMLGILQYIAPTMTLLLGVFLYHESFTKVHLTAFLFIWGALAVYTASSTIQAGIRKRKNKAA